VPFDLLPAIDVHGGRLARLVPGPPPSIRSFPGDPLARARAFVAAGARWIHVVDLSSVLGDGTPTDVDLLERLCALSVRVQIGGGLSEGGVRAALACGADRAVLGPAALSRPGIVERAIEEHGDRVGVGVDARDGRVHPRGGGEPGPPLAEAFARLATAQPAVVVFAGPRRDGTLSGPDGAGCVEAARAVGAPVLASGGVRSIEDLLTLRAASGVAGAIVGRAIHEGAFDVALALAALAESDPSA
jgi:phosphoribosylformimino-5-aminoimidazole carboxamide ribotide isomerase